MAKIHHVTAITGDYDVYSVSTVLAYTHLGSAKAHAKRANAAALGAGVHTDQPKADWDDYDDFASDADPKAFARSPGIKYKVVSYDVADNLADGLAQLAAN